MANEKPKERTISDEIEEMITIASIIEIKSEGAVTPPQAMKIAVEMQRNQMILGIIVDLWEDTNEVLDDIHERLVVIANKS